MVVTHQLIISKAAVHAPLKDWIGIYADQLASDTTFTVYTDKRGYQAIRCSEVLNDDLFFYLVNSLAEACESVHRKEVHGFTTGKDYSDIRGKEVVVYVSDDKEDCCNVTAMVSNDEAYSIDFGGRVTSVTPQDCFETAPDLSSFYLMKTLRVPTVNVNQQEEERRSNSASTRKIAVWGVIGAITTFMFAISIQREFRALLPIALFSILLASYQPLQKLKGYLAFFTITVVCTGLFIWATDYYQDADMRNLLFFPLSAILIQPPLRGLFIALVGREPVMEKPIPSIADFFTLSQSSEQA